MPSSPYHLPTLPCRPLHIATPPQFLSMILHPSIHWWSYTQAFTDDPKPSTLPTQSTKVDKTTTSSTHKLDFLFPPISFAFIFPCPTTCPTNWSHTSTEKHLRLFLALLLLKCDKGFGEGFFFKTSNFLLQDVNILYISNLSKNHCGLLEILQVVKAISMVIIQLEL
jgi:hypothetical protein